MSTGALVPVLYLRRPGVRTRSSASKNGVWRIGMTLCVPLHRILAYRNRVRPCKLGRSRLSPVGDSAYGRLTERDASEREVLYDLDRRFGFIEGVEVEARRSL